MKKLLRFNINNKVRVRLTDVGRRLHRENHERLIAGLPVNARETLKYCPPKEDADGFSEWAAWVLMEEFGPHIRLGCHVPFETNIEIEYDEPAPTPRAS